jgi:hypothetical protein
VDEDLDGDIDCDDTDCTSDPACAVPSSETDCADGVDEDQDGDTDCDDSDCAADAACLTTGTSPPEGCWDGGFLLSATEASMGSDTCDGGLIDPANADLNLGLQYNSANANYDINGSGTCAWQGAFGPLFASYGTPTFSVTTGTLTGPDASGISTMDITYQMGFVSNTISATSNSASSFTLTDGTQTNPTNFAFSAFSGTYYATVEVNWTSVGGPNGCP